MKALGNLHDATESVLVFCPEIQLKIEKRSKLAEVVVETNMTTLLSLCVQHENKHTRAKDKWIKDWNKMF